MALRNKVLGAIFIGLGMSLSVGHSLAADEDLTATDAGLFKSADLNNDGKISRREIIHYSDLVFLSMDANNDDVLTVEEFLQWDPGYEAIAAKRGKAANLNSAKRDVYKLADLNGDGLLDHDEFSVVSLYEFYKADANHDRTLNQDELIGGYRILKISRAAIE